MTEDPASTWPLLTPEYQAVTGGYDDYTGYWSTIEKAKPKEIEAAADGRTVSFETETERIDGSKVTEVVTLQLQRTEDGYLIAGQG